MDEVNLFFAAVDTCLEACCLLLDLLVETLIWLLRLLSGNGGVPSVSAVVEYLNFILLSFLTAAEAWLQALGGVLESFKMAGHLCCHVAWRVKDALHRGLVSGSCVLRQMCEGCCVALSLLLYFINTAVNVILMAMQTCATVLVGVWEAVAAPVHKALELALTALTFVYTCLVGVSVLLWTPCQLLLDTLGALGHVCGAVFTFDALGLLIGAAVVLLPLLLLLLLLVKPRIPDLTGRPSLRLVNALQGTNVAQRLRVMIPVYQAQEANRLPHLDTDGAVTPEVNLSPATALRDGELARAAELEDNDGGGGSPPTDSEPARVAELEDDGSSGGGSPTDSEPARMAEPVNSGIGRNRQTDGELLNLLNEEEERKKCVICQDLTKTVLLLPCRHLCLCRPCTDILTQQRPVQQRCCPLCRQHITQTVDVFL